MRKVAIVLILCLMLLACKSGNEITGKVIADVEDTKEAAPTKTAPKVTKTEKKAPAAPAREDSEENQPEQYSDVTDVKVYDEKGTCTTDSKGVVRHFNEAGRKTVYRDECDFGFLVTYACEGNAVTSNTEKCLGECSRTPYGDVCQ